MVKIGGECGQMLKGLNMRLSVKITLLIIKSHKKSYSSLIYNKDFARILPLILNEKGVLNIGGKRQTIYNFAKKDNPNIKKTKLSKNSNYPLDSSLNLKKFKKILKKIKYDEKANYF